MRRGKHDRYRLVTFRTGGISRVAQRALQNVDPEREVARAGTGARETIEEARERVGPFREARYEPEEDWEMEARLRVTVESNGRKVTVEK